MPPKIRFSRALIARNLSHSLTLYSRLSENGDDPLVIILNAVDA